MEKEKFEEIVKQLKLGLQYEKQLETEIKLKQLELEKIREQKIQLIIAIANKDLYQRLFKENNNESK